MRRISYIITTLLSLVCLHAIAQPNIEQGKTQTWYGRVNRWGISQQILLDELDLMKECGVSGYMIEMAGWEQHPAEAWSREWIRSIDKSYRHLVKNCRKRDLWLFVSIVNDNMGKGKYGDTGPALESVYNSAQQLVKIIKKYGHKGIIVQPVAETQTPAGRRFEEYCTQELEDFTLVYNGNGGHPKTTLEGYDFRAVHPSHIVSSVADEAFVISDHRILIRELSIDGGLESKGDPTKVKAWAERLQQRGIAVVGYYAFKYDQFDPATIRALGETLK